MIEVHGLVKRYGGKRAVNGLTFTVQPGVVTGFLGRTGWASRPRCDVIVGLARQSSNRSACGSRASERASCYGAAEQSIPSRDAPNRPRLPSPGSTDMARLGCVITAAPALGGRTDLLR